MTNSFDPQHDALSITVTGSASANGKPSTAPRIAPGRSGFWNKRAPKPLRRGSSSAEEAWRVYWSERKIPPTAQKVYGTAAPLKWALLSDQLGVTTSKLVEATVQQTDLKQLRKSSRAKERQNLQANLAEWLTAAKAMPAGYDLAIGCLAATQLVGELGGGLDASLGWRIINMLIDTANQASLGRSIDQSRTAAVSEQCLASELPFALAYYFHEMAPIVALAEPVKARLSEALAVLLDDEGLPQSRYFGTMRPLLACWTRCGALGKAIDKRPWSKVAQQQYEGLVRQSLRWTAPDGAAIFAGVAAGPWQDGLLEAALRLGGSKKEVAAARKVVDSDATTGDQTGGKRRKSRRLPDASYNSDWSNCAVLRSGWSSRDAIVAVDYSEPQMRVEAYANGRLLLGGEWAFKSLVDGDLLQPHGTWEELCWFSDKDVDYLELSLPLEGGARLERQILLGHKDRFLLLADHLQHSDGAALEHTWQVPLGQGLLYCGEGETRDALLVDGTPRARLVPLALPEWRIDPRTGELSQSGQAVVLAQRSQARNMACPLFIDLSEQRSAKASTWRQLTVGEALRIQPSDVAVAYRIQEGRNQWVYYRSQGPRGNRTFMGHNTSSEFLMARFKAPSGETRTLVEIEG